jgi:hypothetical protein
MKDSLVQQCLDILKREDVKKQCKSLFKPLLEFIVYEINPYIYITVILIFLIFVMMLIMLVLLIYLLFRFYPLLTTGTYGPEG